MNDDFRSTLVVMVEEKVLSLWLAPPLVLLDFVVQPGIYRPSRGRSVDKAAIITPVMTSAVVQATRSVVCHETSVSVAVVNVTRRMAMTQVLCPVSKVSWSKEASEY